MVILKEQHEAFARFFAEPTREALRELLRRNMGETDYLDFKADWPVLQKLARHVLALANSGGGALVVGVTQEANGSLVAGGMAAIKDKAQLIPPLSAYLPKALEYEILDFTFAASEYEMLVGKSFQVLLVEDTPKHLPFLALKKAEDLRTGAIYVRMGTTSTEAGHVELQEVINRRIESGHSSQPELELDKHLAQLRALDEQRDGNDSWISEFLRHHESRFEDRQSSDYKNLIEHAYGLKKQLILRLLGL
ncbi:ATP-binding protein [Lysobacter yananisis]|uniref:ATP-binding protein n=1 Tax=Lysobacter yananisis TaxID=1003114 RepID=A0ABY9PF85_9GAMM|nr:ATP-binding protein [Lysobacter yananisis]WMT05718.1 ATP-binding protein [Lysobacter yananisis]